MEVLVIFGTLVFLIGFCWSADPCADIIFKKVAVTGKHFNSASSTPTVASAQECAEKCRDNSACKSFGFHSPDIRCSLYDGRIYAGATGQVESDWIYYWALEAECPTAYTLFTNGTSSAACYKYNATGKIWTEAQEACQSDGGHLFLADTQFKKDLLADKAVGYFTYTFLGATDAVEEGVWDWLNGVPINGEDFIPGRPDNFNSNQHCLAYKKGSPPGLDDRECDTATGYLCEIPLKEQSQIVNLPAAPATPATPAAVTAATPAVPAAAAPAAAAPAEADAAPADD